VFFGRKARCYHTCYGASVTSPYDNRRDHVLREPLEKVVAKAVAANEETSQIVEAILAELDEQNLIYYKPRNAMNLFTPSGRVLVMLLDRPGMTVREMSVSLGCSTASIIKSLSMLDKDGLLVRSKQDGRNEYRIKPEAAVAHQDLRRLVRVIAAALK
jgi:uncharacterized membrane protein